MEGAAMELRTPVQGQSRGHVEIIDVIRGFAALSVASLHIREVNWIGMRGYWATHSLDWSLSALSACLSFPVVWGSIGVPIFFVISGYVIHRGSCNKVMGAAGARTFWLRRFIRIYPTFLAAILVTWALDTFSIGHGINAKFGDLSFGNAALNLLALVGIDGTAYGSDGALWSLAIEIQFYAIYPLALVVWRRVGSTMMLYLTLAISIAGYLIFTRRGEQLFVTYYFSWWLGAYIADRQGHATATTKCLMGGLIVLGMGCVVFFLKIDILTFMVWSIGCAMLLHFILNRDRCAYDVHGGRLAWIYKALAQCGGFSYSLYAVHLPIAVAFNTYFFGGKKQENIAWMIPCLALALIGGYLIYLAVEVPSIKTLQALSRRKRPAISS
jgi:peptidoglycan/LPS O-acetylase OafA/YrhL